MKIFFTVLFNIFELRFGCHTVKKKLLTIMGRSVKVRPENSPPLPLRKLYFILIEALIYVVCIIWFFYLMGDIWQKYIKKATTFVSSFEGSGDDAWPLPYITLCPTSAFKSRDLLLTQQEYDTGTYSSGDIFYNLTKLTEDFTINETNTVANGKCFTVTDKKQRYAKDFVTVHLKRNIDLDIYFIVSTEDLVMKKPL